MRAAPAPDANGAEGARPAPADRHERRLRLQARLYLANAAVLLVHQMDATYRHEWTLFGLPGGLPLFLALNVPIALLVLAGYGAVAARRPGARASAWLLAASGLFAAAFHAVHLARGDAAFTAPVSLALLTDTLVLSLAQVATLLAGRERRTRASPAVV